MSKTETDMKVIKSGECATISTKSRVTYQIAIDEDSGLHIRITNNTGGGFFSNEWISMKDIQAVMEEHPKGTPITSFILYRLFKGRSVNTPAFLLAALAHEKLMYPMKGKKRSLEPAVDFTAMVEKMASSKTTNSKTAGNTTKKAVSKKAIIKKKALSRKKTARTV